MVQWIKISKQVVNSLKIAKKEAGLYDDIMCDDAKIQGTDPQQTFLISKGYFNPKEYFKAIKIDNLDDQTRPLATR